MRFFRTLCVAVCLSVGLAFAQSDRGTISGTVSDPAGAVVPNAQVEARNTGSGTTFQASSSGTGNYTLSSLPAGSYELSVTVTGFKKYLRPDIQVQVAGTARVDVQLQVGAASESVTVTSEVSQLKTESGDVSHIISSSLASNLPVLTIGGGAGFGAIRNPLQLTTLLPGAQFAQDLNLRINGLPSNTGTIRVEGQDASNGLWRQQASQLQQGVESIQEVAVQTSNYAAEYGQAAGGYFNFTTKSGTNAFHASVYDYYVNEVLNAGLPYTNAGDTNSVRQGEHVRNRQRRNDYGFTVGGPISIPKVYNGHDKSFFFFNWEQFRETRGISNGLQTVPTAAYRNGDFSTAVPVCLANTTAAACSTGIAGASGGTLQLTQSGVTGPAKDQLGRVIPQFGVYDPASSFTAGDGSLARNLFPGGKIDVTKIDPVSLKIQAMLPAPTNGALINNYNVPGFNNPKTTSIPSIKIDHSFGANSKISGYLSRTLTRQPNFNGLDPLLTGVNAADNRSSTFRLNYDHTLSPTLLLHIGVGYLYLSAPGVPQAFDQSTIGLKGFYSDTFPSIGGLFNGTTGGTAFPIGAGTFGNQHQWDEKPTGNVTVTWVKDNHTFKFGGELIIDGVINRTDARANGIFGFSVDQTRNPWENGQPGLNSNSGFSYASFLLGQVQSLQTSPKADMRLGNHAFSFFGQDTWKVTRRLTVEYGLRYDYQTYLKEQYGRMQSANFSAINTKIGYPGTVQYEGFQPGQCQCNFSSNYPYAFGPRLSAAYQIDSKTVLRAGSALTYGTASNNSFLSLSIADFYTINAPGFGANALQGGLQGGNPFAPGNPYGNPTLTWPNFDPNKYPTAGICPGTLSKVCYTPQSPFIYIDPDSRPPRIFQGSIGVQRELARNLVLDVSYVMNRGAWFTAPALSTGNYNTLTPAIVTKYGLDLVTDRTLLTSPMGSSFTQQLAAGVVQHGLQLPYAGFPITQNLAQGLVARPQWGPTIPPFLGPPLGKTWYDSLQVKLTKRYSHGLDMQTAFTWGKELALGANSDSGYLGTPANSRVNDVFNRDTNKQLSPLSQPLRLVIAVTYTTPGLGGANGMAMKAVSHSVKDWQIGAVLSYQSGALIPIPSSNNNLFGELNRGGGLFGGGQTYQNFASGMSIANGFLKDPNCHCFDPTQELVLNPAAWTEPTIGQFASTAGYYNGYRWQRQPTENVNLGRNFRMGHEGKMNLQIRVEFQNVLNRHFYGMPSNANPIAPTLRANPNSTLSAGYGFVNFLNGAGAIPRAGTLVGRFSF